MKAEALRSEWVQAAYSATMRAAPTPFATAAEVRWYVRRAQREELSEEEPRGADDTEQQVC